MNTVFERIANLAKLKEKKSADKATENMLKKYYQNVQDAGGGTPEIWELILPCLDSTPTEPERLQEPKTLSPRLLRRRIAGIVGALIVLNIASFYFIPRWEVAVASMLPGNHSATSVTGGIFYDDPGLLRTFQQGAFQPVGLKATAAGITLEITDFYTDSNRTVVVYRITPPKPSSRQGLVMQNWAIATSNLLDVQLNSSAQQTSVRDFPVYLSDQFGDHYEMRGITGQGNGYGYIEFGSLTSLGRLTGLRLSLNVSAMQAILAPKGPFAAKRAETRTGPWKIAFLAFPNHVPHLHLTPNFTVEEHGVTFTLRSVSNANSDSELELESEGANNGNSPGFATFRFSIIAPNGKPLDPTNSESNGKSWSLMFPPLTTSGTYTLVIKNKDTIWKLPWSQPQWLANHPKWTGSDATPPIYRGTDWKSAANLLDFPAYSPPPGYIVEKMTVVPDNRAILSGNETTTPLALYATLKTPDGKQVQIVESRTLLTPIPEFMSLDQFLANLRNSSGSGFRGFHSTRISGIPAQEWKVLVKTTDGRKPYSMLYLYPTWGSVELESINPHESVTLMELRQVATDLLAVK
ncbi:hypothetical protein CEB3_c22600 [Peptococcaceae bacterium CEB3]|nr:hypothetical protein CEB3_c22600 [Peptococcaceae bacterium CEB3]